MRASDTMWLDRARAFAMHGLAQMDADAAKQGQSPDKQALTEGAQLRAARWLLDDRDEQGEGFAIADTGLFMPVVIEEEERESPSLRRRHHETFGASSSATAKAGSKDDLDVFRIHNVQRRRTACRQPALASELLPGHKRQAFRGDGGSDE